MFKNVARFLKNSTRKGVKKMKSLRVILVGLLCSFLAVGNAGAVSFTTTVTADVTSTSTISVDPATIDFGTIGATGTNYRKRTPSANVTFFPAGSYEIRVYTDNGVGAVALSTDPLVRGYIRNATTGKLYLKIWCPNFSANKVIPATGPVLSTTTSQTDYLWKGFDLNKNDVIDTTALTTGTYRESGATGAGIFVTGQDLNGDGVVSTGPTGDIVASATNPVGEDASFSFVREQETFAGHEEDTIAVQREWRCVLAWNTTGRGDGSLGSPFPVFFASDLMGVSAGLYSSANNTGGTSTAGVFFDLKIY